MACYWAPSQGRPVGDNEGICFVQFILSHLIQRALCRCIMSRASDAGKPQRQGPLGLCTVLTGGHRCNKHRTSKTAKTKRKGRQAGQRRATCPRSQSSSPAEPRGPGSLSAHSHCHPSPWSPLTWDGSADQQYPICARRAVCTRTSTRYVIRTRAPNLSSPSESWHGTRDTLLSQGKGRQHPTPRAHLCHHYACYRVTSITSY